MNRIVDFISRDKKQAAAHWTKTVYKKVSRLKRFPKSGRVVPEFRREEIREILVGSYRIIYGLTSQIDILTIFHGAKLIEKI